MTIRKRKQFDKQARALIERLGGKKNPPMSHYDYTMETSCGTLNLIVDTDYRKSVGTVFTRFDDPTRAVRHGIDCNSYTGKWNHYYGERDPDEAIRYLEMTLDWVA